MNFIIGNKTFTFNKPVQNLKLHDLNLIADFDLKKYQEVLLQESIHHLYSKHWNYYTEIQKINVTQKHLREKVKKSEILAYHYVEASLNLNRVCEYGWILPTNFKNIPCSRKTMSLTGLKVWPREVYVVLEQVGACLSCENCITCKYKTRNLKEVTTCIKKIDWSEIYLFMGDEKEDLIIIPKEQRKCKVCNNCFKCSAIPIGFCKNHKVCKHSSRKFTKDVKLVYGNFKNCTYLK